MNIVTGTNYMNSVCNDSSCTDTVSKFLHIKIRI